MQTLDHIQLHCISLWEIWTKILAMDWQGVQWVAPTRPSKLADGLAIQTSETSDLGLYTFYRYVDCVK